MTNITVDTSRTMEGGYHPALITEGPFKGVSFVVQDMELLDDGMLSFQYTLVSGDIMLEQQQAFEAVITDYIQQAINELLKKEMQKEANLDN